MCGRYGRRSDKQRIAEWFHTRDVAAVATDTLALEVLPCEDKDIYLPVHLLHIVEMGMTQGQNWLLDPLAAKHRSWQSTPPGQWPELDLSLAGLSYPDRLNAADELLDATIAAHGPNRRCLLSPRQSWTYGDLAAREDGQVES